MSCVSHMHIRQRYIAYLAYLQRYSCEWIRHGVTNAMSD